MIWILAGGLAGICCVCALALYLAEMSEVSKYERDELPEPKGGALDLTGHRWGDREPRA